MKQDIYGKRCKLLSNLSVGMMVAVLTGFVMIFSLECFSDLNLSGVMNFLFGVAHVSIFGHLTIVILVFFFMSRTGRFTKEHWSFFLCSMTALLVTVGIVGFRMLVFLLQGF